MLQVRIKFCGMTRAQDIIAASELGIHAIGLILYSASSRCVTLKQAKQLIQEVPPFINIVGVVVNPSEDEVKTILDQLALDYLQFHGTESFPFCDSFHFPYIKAIPAIQTKDILQQIATYSTASAILLDTPAPNFGGTGKTFDWGMIPELRSKPLIVAGGLTAQNIKEAVSIVKPYAVDICSGIEKSPGIKDWQKMKNLVEAVWAKG